MTIRCSVYRTLSNLEQKSLIIFLPSVLEGENHFWDDVALNKTGCF